MLRGDDRAFARRVLMGAVVVVGVAALAAALVLAADVLLIVFAAVLLAIMLHGLAGQLACRTPLSPHVALAMVGVLLLALPAAVIWWIAPDIPRQVDELTRELPQALDQLKQRLAGIPLLQPVLADFDASRLVSRPDLLGRITGFFSTSFGALANVLIVLVIGIYLAIDPTLYLDAIAKPFPLNHRERVKGVLRQTGTTLAWWIAGKAISMVIIGVLTGVGLVLLGVPLPVPLALIAALLTFIPNIGPILSVIPAALLALVQDPMLAAYVVALYAGIQFVESYLVTPLIQKRLVSLPPAAILFAQLLAGVLLGGVGLVLATPLTLALVVLVRKVYLEGVLGEPQRPLSPH